MTMMEPGNFTNGIEDELDEDVHIFDNPYVRAVLILLYTTVFIFCFFGNLTVVLVTTFHWRMRGVTKFCLSNLALANLCVGIFCVYQNLSLYFFNEWIFGEFFCKMYHFVNSLSHTASIFILVVISVERYLAILHPFRCRQLLTIPRLRLIIVGVWILSAVICSPRIFYMAILEDPFSSNPRGKPHLVCVPRSKIYNFKTSDLIHFVLLYLVPLSVISFLYAKVGLFLRGRDVICRDIITNNSSFSETKSEDRTQCFCEPPLDGKKDNNRNSYGRFLQSYEEEEEDEDDKLSSQEDLRRLKGESPVLDPTEKVVFQNNNLNPVQKSSAVASSSSSLPVQTFLQLNERTMVRINFSRQVVQYADCSKIVCFSSKKLTPPTQRPHKAVVRMLIIFVLSFALCNLPHHLRKLYQNYLLMPSLDGYWSELLTPSTYLLMYANCAINPFLYGFMSKSFRSCCIDLIKCRLRKSPEEIVDRRFH